MRNLIAAALIAAEGLLAWSGAPVAAADSPCATLGGDVVGEEIHLLSESAFDDLVALIESHRNGLAR